MEKKWRQRQRSELCCYKLRKPGALRSWKMLGGAPWHSGPLTKLASAAEKAGLSTAAAVWELGWEGHDPAEWGPT